SRDSTNFSGNSLLLCPTSMLESNLRKEPHECRFFTARSPNSCAAKFANMMAVTTSFLLVKLSSTTITRVNPSSFIRGDIELTLVIPLSRNDEESQARWQLGDADLEAGCGLGMGWIPMLN